MEQNENDAAARTYSDSEKSLSAQLVRAQQVRTYLHSLFLDLYISIFSRAFVLSFSPSATLSH